MWSTLYPVHAYCDGIGLADVTWSSSRRVRAPGGVAAKGARAQTSGSVPARSRCPVYSEVVVVRLSGFVNGTGNRSCCRRETWVKMEEGKEGESEVGVPGTRRKEAQVLRGRVTGSFSLLHSTESGREEVFLAGLDVPLPID